MVGLVSLGGGRGLEKKHNITSMTETTKNSKAESSAQKNEESEPTVEENRANRVETEVLAARLGDITISKV